MAKGIVYGEIVEEFVEDESVSSLSKEMSPLLSLNHVSFICRSVSRSVKFYEEVLGFVRIRRPSSFDFKGAWLFNHGMGIHLLEVDTASPTKKGVINPKDNHISFQCTDMDLIIKKLDQLCIEFVTAVVKDSGIEVNQLFFHDPDGYMIEICNCHVLPVLPMSTSAFPTGPQTNHSTYSFTTSNYQLINGTGIGITEKMRSKNILSCGEETVTMMDNLLVDMMEICF